MKKAVLSIGLIGCTLVLISCQSRIVETLTLTHYSLTNESVKLVKGTPSEQPISISVSSRVTEENNELTRVSLANGQLVDGELKLDRQVTEPTEIVISVKFVTDEITRRIVTVLSPAAKIEFVVIQRASSYGNRWDVLLKREANRSLDENRKFSVEGDLNQLLDSSPELVQVSLRSEPSLLDGSGDTMRFGPVFAEDGAFSVKGDLEKPTLFIIEISHGARVAVETQRLYAILEPGVNYDLVSWGNHGKIAVRADRDSMHSRLVSNWQFNPEVVAIINTRKEELLDARWGMEREAVEEYEREQIRNYQVAEQCEHVKLSNDVKLRFIEPYEYSYQNTADQIVTSWSDSFQQILRDTQDPELARMILELSWRQLLDDEIIRTVEMDDRVAILIDLLEALAPIMDKELVEDFITPKIEALMEGESTKMKISSVRPGQLAPKFTLTTISGDEVSLSEVVNENELVLVVFWASWCHWCTRGFPEFKRMYSKNKDRGFEIVTVSIDESFAEWKTASKARDLRWIDLGDPKDNQTKKSSLVTANSYEVRLKDETNSMHGLYRIVYSHIISSNDNRFLIDQDGCIVNMRFADDELREILSSTLTDIN